MGADLQKQGTSCQDGNKAPRIFEVKAGKRGSRGLYSMQLQGKPGSHYPKMKYHWTKEPVIVNNADEGAALGGGWADTPAAFSAYRGPRQARTAQQNAIQWVDDWPVGARRI